ncbi:MAG: PKD domain-containing protein, partial [Candidatus Gracilibacteria bacterium]|nr:PKD domain-containing protein [Candidatus Gracilibacteria bacterium]
MSDKKQEPSLLSEILSSATPSHGREEVDLMTPFIAEEGTGQGASATPGSKGGGVKKVARVPMKTGDFLRIVGAILLVSFIFFGAFLAYIVFNPGQAQFFLSFGINPSDIASLLQNLVNGIFGMITFVLSVGWIILLFRAILTKKEYRKKKTLAIIFSVFTGIILFSTITLWAFLVQQINATDYQNPNGGVIIFDNEKLLSDRYKNTAQLNSFDNLIGPMELRFDLKSDANFVSKSMNIEDYTIDFDGGKCRGTESSTVEGTNPASDQSIICVFDSAKSFKPSGVYNGIDKLTREKKSVAINFPVINISGVVDIRRPKNQKENNITYEATKLTSLGNVTWYTEKNGNTPVSTNPVYSIALGQEQQILCLSVFVAGNCDKIFIVPAKGQSSVSAKIVYERDPENPLTYLFRLEDVRVKTGEITGYKWIVDGTTVASTEESFEYTFTDYKETKVTIQIRDSAGNMVEISENINVAPPLSFVKGPHAESLLKISDSTEKSLIDDTYSKSLKGYLISGINMDVPTIVGFDATDVKVDNYGYELTNVEWDFNNDGTFEKTGEKVKYELIEEKRYTVTVRYTFTAPEQKESGTLEEKIFLEPKKKNISVSLKVNQDSEYAPATIHVDGSASQLKEGTITKFMYDFGEGRGPVEGDAIQDYRYNFPGEYTITFTVVKSDGTREQTSRKIVLKDVPKQIVINTS